MPETISVDDTFGINRYEDGYLTASVRLQPGLAKANGKLVDIPLTTDSIVQRCEDTVDLLIKLDCSEDVTLSRLVNHQQSKDIRIFEKQEFWVFLIVISAAFFSFGAGCTFQDSICTEICKQGCILFPKV